VASTYQAWETNTGDVFFRKDHRAEIERIGEDRNLRRLLFEVVAETFEEAMSIYNLRMGYGPYVPSGQPSECPVCASWYYPEGSGQCWKCNTQPVA